MRTPLLRTRVGERRLPDRQAQAVWDVISERQRQIAKWGEEQHHDPGTWLLILSEEIGELSEALLHAKFGGPEAKNVRAELIQVTAVALQMLETVNQGFN